MDTQPHQSGNVVATAGRVLSALGLVTAFGHVSQRGDGRMLITPAADLAGVSAADVIPVDLTAAEQYLADEFAIKPEEEFGRQQ